MQTQQTQRKSMVCGSGVQRRQMAPVQVERTEHRTNTKAKSQKIGGYVATIALPRKAISLDVSLFKIVSAIALFAITIYLYMIVSIVVATVERKSLEERVREESTELTYRETEYSKLVGSITLASARASGYIDANNSGFATRADAPTLTLNNE
jgi:hypothetical protein